MLKSMSLATQEACSTGGGVRLYKSGEHVGEACWCMDGGKDTEEVGGYRGGSTEEVIQKICVSTGGVCLYGEARLWKRCVACYRGRVHVYKKCVVRRCAFI